MGIVINTNVQSLNSQRLLRQNTNELSKSFERLASGFRINRASDDAAGLQISEGLRSQIRGSEQAFNNVQDGINVLNTVDGALGTIVDSLQRVRELAVQAANDTNSATQRSAISQEVQQLVSDITRVSRATTFNDKGLLNGSQATFYIQLGAESGVTANTINLASAGSTNPFGSVNGDSLSLGSDGGSIILTANSAALNAISLVDAAIQTVNNRRATVGALTNRLDRAGQNLQIAIENFSSSESRIRNVDVARETANLTRNQILQQASSTILAQANQAPQLALQLLG